MMLVSSWGTTRHCITLLLSSLAVFIVRSTASLANGVDLRIQPIGDSITYGYQSSDGNGYRNDLLQKFSGNNVRFIGSRRAGSMSNNQNDGYSGFEINQIAAKIGSGLAQKPNVVLLMAGTNDVNNDHDPGDAPARLGSLLDQIIAGSPNAVIILAKITPIADDGAENRAQIYNAAIPGVAQSRMNAGHKIVVVDMQNTQDGLTAGDLIDGLHPTDAGYAKMANVWWDGLTIASNQGLISAPEAGTSASSTGSAVCNGNLFWYNNHGTIASGVGASDGPFSSSWIPKGTVASGTGAGPGVRIADLDGDGYDDYVWVDPKSGAAHLYTNGGYSDGKVNWIGKGQIASGVGDGAGVRFADITGDGRADYIWISTTGELTAYVNNGPASGGGWNWAPLNNVAVGLDTGSRDSIIFADLDGDGRADFSIVGDGGSLKSWIATGTSLEPQWLPLGHVASGIGDAAGVHLVDLNGDGRADYVWVNNASASYGYINLRRDNNLAPKWIDVGQLGTGVGTGRGNITFGDLTGDGKADFLIVHNDTGGLDMYLNNGKGGAYQAGDQIVFADLDGDGQDDYISIGPEGSLLAYQNGGVNTGANNGWNWIDWGTIASGAGKREQIRMADLNGDGKADYIIVDDKTGAISAYLNRGQNPGANLGWNWVSTGIIASGIAPGRTIHFADIDGDGKADYLSVDGAGGVTAYLNGGPNSQANLGWVWISAGRIASGVGPGVEVRFADIDGDGLADYLILDKSTGALTEYRNGGPNSGANGRWIWINRGQIADGVGVTGQSVVFGAVSSRRADYITINAGSAAAFLWANGCDGTVGSGGGSGSSGGSLEDGDDDYPDNYQPPFDSDHYPKCLATFSSLDILNSMTIFVPPTCMNQYIVDTLVSSWDAAMKHYQDLNNGGYDSKFKTYSDFVKQQVPSQINAFMGNGHADDYFDCVKHGTILCCKDCRFGPCEGCSKASNCKSGPGSQKITCPTQYAKGPAGINSNNQNTVPNTTYTLRESDKFYSAIDNDYSVQKSWINSGDTQVVISQACQNAGANVKTCEKENGIWFWNYPEAGSVDVVNPKDIVSQSMGAAQNMIGRLRTMEFASKYDAFSQITDLVDAGSLPSLSVVTAVQAMATVAAAGEELQEEQKRDEIISFVTAILFFIPFVGDAAGAAGLTAARTVLGLVDAAGNVGLSIYSIVQDPSSALQTVMFGLITAGLDRGNWAAAGRARRAMSSDEIGKLGSSIRKGLDNIGSARVRACQR